MMTRRMPRGNEDECRFERREEAFDGATRGTSDVLPAPPRRGADSTPPPGGPRARGVGGLGGAPGRPTMGFEIGASE